MAKFSMIQTRVHSNMLYLPPGINVSKFVFVRQDTIKKSLQPKYDEPYKVLERPDKFFIIKKNNKKNFIAIDRLKPAYIEKPSDRFTENEPVVHENKDENIPSTNKKYDTIRKTKSCRHIHRPSMYYDAHTDIHSMNYDAHIDIHSMHYDAHIDIHSMNYDAHIDIHSMHYDLHIDIHSMHYDLHIQT